jgi:hypothetical protein
VPVDLPAEAAGRLRSTAETGPGFHAMYGQLLAVACPVPKPRSWP